MPEGDIHDTEGDRVGEGASGFGVFPNPEKVVEGNVGEVGDGSAVGAVVGVGTVLVEEELSEGDRHSELGFGGRVLSPVAI